MVDALREAWRVLVDDGLLVDLRPLSSTGNALDLVSERLGVRVGEIDADGMSIDDRASDEAIARVVEEGLFVPSSSTRFEFEFSWDTVREMSVHLESSRRVTSVQPSYAELEKLLRAERLRGARRPRLRYSRTMLLAVYRKSSALDDSHGVTAL